MKNSWQTKKIGEVCSFKRGLTYSKKDEVEFSSNRVLRANNIDLKSGSLNLSDIKHINNAVVIEEDKKVKKNTVLICTASGSKSHLGKVAFIREDMDFAFGGFMGLLIPSDELDARFFYYYLISDKYKTFIEKLSDGANINNLKFSQIDGLEIPVPPLPEQKRIISLLDDLFEKLDKVKENVEKNLQNAAELFDSYLSIVFTNSGRDWNKKKLGDIGKVSMCKRVFKDQTTKTGDIPFYKIGTFGKEPNAYISNKIYNEFRKKFSFPKKGDILISASGTIGRRVKYNGEPAYFQDSNIVWIDNDEKQVLNDYLYHFYGACNWNSTKGATISRLYNDNLMQIEISFPKSISEQKIIINRLDNFSTAIQKLESIYEKKITNFEELKQSILHQAFTGKL